uniref:Uncharacterized protein n=1 Tax=Romanomermis culicivorax TaxID=13658 RepID=A0A915KKQ4_ROMCU
MKGKKKSDSHILVTRYSRPAGIVDDPERSTNQYGQPNGTVGHPLHNLYRDFKNRYINTVIDNSGQCSRGKKSFKQRMMMQKSFDKTTDKHVENREKMFGQLSNHILLQLPMTDLFTISLAEKVKHFTSILDLIYPEPTSYNIKKRDRLNFDRLVAHQTMTKKQI